MPLYRLSCGAIPPAMLTITSAGAAPIAPLVGSEQQATRMVPARFGLGDHPLMYEGNWREHQRQWEAFEGRNVRSSCARLRGYDRATHSSVDRKGRRVACR